VDRQPGQVKSGNEEGAPAVLPRSGADGWARALDTRPTRRFGSRGAEEALQQPERAELERREYEEQGGGGAK
jgi:hypothetical protein